MKSKTRSRLVILLAVATAAGAGLGGYVAWHKHARAAEMVLWRAQGMAAFAAGDYSKALELLGNYAPEKDPEALYAMARARLKLVEPKSNYLIVAEGWLSRVVDLDPSNDEARRTLLGLYKRLNQAPEALSLAESMLVANPKDVEALRAKGNALLVLRKYTKRDNGGKDGARETYQQILKLIPMDLESHQLILATMSQDKSILPADFVNYAAKLPPDDPAANIIASIAYACANDAENAKSLALKAATFPTTDSAVVLLITHQLDSMGLFDKATDYLEARAAKTTSPETRRDWTLRMFYLNRFTDVISFLNSFAMKPVDADADTMAAKCYSLVKLDKKDEALQQISVLKSNGASNPRAAAWAKLLEASLLDDSSPQDDSSHARDRFTAIKTAIESQLADSPLAGYLDAKAWASRGFADQALQIWTNCASMVPVWAEPLVSASRMEQERQALGMALELAKRAAVRLPDDPEVNVAFACAWAPQLRPGDTPSLEGMLRLIDKIDRSIPMEHQTLSIKLLCLAGLGRKDEALKVVDDALVLKPPLSEVDFVRLAMAAAGAKEGIAERILDAAQKANKEKFAGISTPEALMNGDGLTSFLAFTRARLLLQAGHGPEGLKYLETLLEVQKPADQRGPRAGNVEWQARRAEYLDLLRDKSAAELWALLADANVENYPIQWAALTSPSLASNFPVRDRILKRLEADPDAASIVKFFRGRWYVETDSPSAPVADRIKSFQQADALFREYLAATPRAVMAHLLRAECLEMIDRLQHPGQAPKLMEAIEELKTAHGLDPSDVNTILLLAKADIEQVDLAAVPDVLQPLLSKDFPATGDQRYAAANFLAHAGKIDAALSMLKWLAAPSNNEQSRLAAGLYQLTSDKDPDYQGNLAKAEELVKKILEHPDPVDVQFAAEYYANTHRPELAAATIKALDSLPMPPGARALDAANFYLAHGDLPDAQTQTLQAIQEAPTASAPRRQLITLRILQGDVKGTDEAIRIAAKEVHDDPTLNMALANIAVLTHFVTMAGLRPLVASALKDPSEGAGSLDALQVLTNAENTGELLTVTTPKLRAIADAHPHNLELQMITIQAYARCGHMDDARAVADRAMQAFPNSPEPAQLAANTLAALHQWEDTILRAQEWKRRAPQQALLADQRIADAQVYLRRSADALKTLEPYMATARADPDHYAPAIILYARALMVANRFDDARALVRPLIQKSGEWRMAALTLIVDGVTVEQVAGDWLKEIEVLTAPNSLERARVAQAWYNLYDRFRNIEFSKHSKTMLEEIAKNPDCPEDVLSTLGMVYEILEDPQHAEDMYDRALHMNPKDPIAGNNLAMIYVRRGDKLKDALDLISAVINDRPSMPAFHDTKAAVLAKMGDLKGAMGEAREAIKIDPENAEWLLTLLEWQTKAKDPDLSATIIDLNARKGAMSADQLKKFTSLQATPG